jgi:small subunit ribosomal protein S6
VPDYELIYILNPDLTEDELTENVNRITTIAKSGGAETQEPQRWTKRRLAYLVKEKREGYYVVMKMKAEPAAVTELERVLRLTEPVLRHMVVRLDEEPAPPEAEKKPAEGAQGAEGKEP